MSASALIFTLALLAADAPASGPPQGEPLPAGAPTEDYPLTAWCYGAMSEYLAIYERVKPDLKAIDKMFGSSQPNEPEPYASDMAAAHKDLKVLADAVTAAEKASPNPIAPQGAIHLGPCGSQDQPGTGTGVAVLGAARPMRYDRARAGF
jgi:hypothetical protein